MLIFIGLALTVIGIMGIVKYPVILIKCKLSFALAVIGVVACIGSIIIAGDAYINKTNMKDTYELCIYRLENVDSLNKQQKADLLSDIHKYNDDLSWYKIAGSNILTDAFIPSFYDSLSYITLDDVMR